MTLPLLKQTIMTTHNRLIEQLEDKYKNHITKLLEQKKLVIIQLQNAVYQQFVNIENVSNQLTPSDLSSVKISNVDSNIETDTILNQIPIFSLKDANPSEIIDSETNHCKEKPFKSDHCNYQSNRKDSATKHTHIHIREKPYKCIYCDYRSATKQRLTNHIRIHTGEKPYKCVLCNKRFRQIAHLNRHTKIHTGERPYGCNQCDYRCITKWNLTMHMRTHARKG